MHSFRYVAALSAFLSAAVAVPMKRELIVNTVTEVEIVTEILTATVWVDATDAPVSQPAQYTNFPHEAHTSAPWVFTTHVVPTTSSTVYVAPSTSTTSSSSTTPYVAPVPTSTSTYVAPAPSTTSSTSQYVAPTSTYVAPVVTTPTSTYVAPVVTTPTSTYVAPTPTTTSTTAAAATSASSSSSGSKTYTGQLTYYDVGLGSCGYTNTDSESVVAMAVGMMDKASMCGKSVTISYGGVTKTAQVVDTCMGCANGNLDMSPTLFEAFAPLTSGRVGGAEWWFN